MTRSNTTFARPILRWTLFGWTAVACGCGSGEESVAPSESSPEVPTLRAEVFTVDSRNWPTTVRAQGSLVADEVAVIGARVAGRVAEVHVDLGDDVAANRELVTLDSAIFSLEVSQAEAQQAQARAAVGLRGDDPVEDLDPANSPPVREAKAIWDEAKAQRIRLAQLRMRDAVTEADLEEAQATEDVAAAQYESAVNSVREKIALIGVRAAELDLARQRLADASVVAPFAGIVQMRHVAPGTYVQIGQPVATLVRTNPLYFRGMLPERHAGRLEIGQVVRLTIESAPAPCEARVTRMSPTLDERTRALLFEAEVDNSDGSLRSGWFAEAEIVVDPDAEAIAVPESAVVEFAGVEKVWKLVDGVTQEQVVLTGSRREGEIEILDGLAAGDRILAQGSEGRVARIEVVDASPVGLTLPDPDTGGDRDEIRNDGETVDAEAADGTVSGDGSGGQ